MKATPAKLLIFALALLVAVALLNLAQNLQSLTFGEVGYGLPRVGFGAGEGVSVGINPLVFAWILALVALGLFIVGYLWKGDWKGRFPRGELLTVILGVLLLFSIIYVTTYIAQSTPEAEEELGLDPGEEGPPGAGDPGVNDPPPPAPEGEFRFGPGSIGLILAFLAFAAIYLLLAKHRFVRRRDLEPRRRERELREKVTGVLGERIYRLELGGDIRSIILGAYRDMVNLFHSYGLRTQGFETAREIEALASGTLGLSGEASTELRRRFEEARYSVHPLTEDKRTAAIESLRRVKRELGA